MAAGRPTTLQQHTVGGRLTPERSRLHAAILQQVVGAAVSSARPHAFLYAGGPASGKTALSEQLRGRESPTAIRIDADMMRVRLPEYREMVEAGDVYAAALTHDEASILAKLAADIAVEVRADLVIDGVGRDDEGQFSAKITRLLAAGYRVTVRYVTVPLAVATAREAERAARTGRFVPAKELVAGHRESTRGFANIVQIPGVRVEVSDTTTDPAVLVADRGTDAQPGAVEVHVAEGYHRFLEKANQ
jgi:predicted ABC-type ATPase